MATSTSINQLNILIVGDTGTGKDCYVKRITDNTYPNDNLSNTECHITSTKIKIDEDTEVPIRIFNISGIQRGKTKIKTHFKNVDGYIIMFDITRGETYDNIMGWKNDIDSTIEPKKLPCILIANKCDLEKDIGVDGIMDGMNNYCEAMGFYSYFEISNKNNIGIQQSIQTLIHEIIKRKKSSELTRLESISDENKRQEYTFKILVLGERGTGKTAIIERYVHNTFRRTYRSTIGADLAVKKIHYNNYIIINLQIWDIAGEERFGGMTHLFYRDAVGCLIVFDVTNPVTLKNSAVKWKIDFDTKVNYDNDNQVPCLLIGNKCDLRKEGIVVSETHMIEFCRTHKFISWYETSAKENTNIKESISFLVEEIMKNIDNRKGIKRTSSDVIKLDDTILPKHSLKNCCNF